MKRAMRSESWPKTSGLYRGRGSAKRRISTGWSSPPKRRDSRAIPTAFRGGGGRPLAQVPRLAPVLGEQVVEHVVDRDRAEQVVVAVHDRDGDEVVRREVAGEVTQRRLRAQR